MFSWYDKDWKGHGAILKSGRYFPFDDPDGIATRGYGLNDFGVIVGAYDRGDRPYGFVALPK